MIEEFTKGQRVKLSDEARARGITIGRSGPRSQRSVGLGTVISILPGNRLSVMADSHRTAVAYHADFWTDATGEGAIDPPKIEDFASYNRTIRQQLEAENARYRRALEEIATTDWECGCEASPGSHACDLHRINEVARKALAEEEG